MDSTLACLAAWMPRQRWYGAKGRTPTLRFVAGWDFPNTDAHVRVSTLLVSDESSSPPVLYQIPVVARAAASGDSETAHVIGNPEPGTTLLDGPTDPAYATALLELIIRGGQAGAAGTLATGIPAPASPATSEHYSARVLTGEQSNTSIIYSPIGGGRPIICKVFRQVHPGLNPDIELQTALAAAGSPYVPRAIGSVEGRWPVPPPGTGTSAGSLAFAQEFLPGVEDAWRVALHAADIGEDFTQRAHDLGVATADVHLDLARHFPTHATTPSDREATAAAWHRRLTIAVAEVPALAEHQSAIVEAYERALAAEWPTLQRIHGDYHLGQVILVPGRGWVLLDFEGEPMRPMKERVRPDLALRDVAGMLRSFDYVSGSLRLAQSQHSPESVRAWADAARQAFLDGYSQRSSAGLRSAHTLLAAFELDKAVYEAIYEARNRPTWIEIPLGAISRLLDRAAPVN